MQLSCAVYMSMLCLVIVVQADDFRSKVSDCCAHNRELYDPVMRIVDDPELSSQEKITSLLGLQRASYTDVQEKIIECVDNYAEVALDLESRLDGRAFILLEDKTGMDLPDSADLFKRRLLGSLAKFDTLSKVALMVAVAGGAQEDSALAIIAPRPSFFDRWVAPLLKNKFLIIGSACLGALALYIGIYKKIHDQKEKALFETPLAEWPIETFDIHHQRLFILSRIQHIIPPEGNNCSEVYETNEYFVVYNDSIELFLQAAREQECILRTYLKWAKWAKKTFTRWLLPCSAHETALIKEKLKRLVLIQEII